MLALNRLPFASPREAESGEADAEQRERCRLGHVPITKDTAHFMQDKTASVALACEIKRAITRKDVTVANG
jgi:hypothetical protein